MVKIKNKIRLLPLMLVILSIFVLGMQQLSSTPTTVYHVYLEGKSIGLTKSKKALEEYIDKEQEKIKEKYGVSKVYAPDSLDIKKEITYSKNILSTEKIYDKIKNSSSFTVDGYKITIKKTNATTNDSNKIDDKDKIVYVIDKKVFTKAIDKTVKSFIEIEDYKTYKSNKKQTIKDTGKIIEKITIQNDVAIKETRIPTNKTIYKTTDELVKYLLFGNNVNEETYVTKEGDTISDVAFNNKMSNDEFLIINPNFKDENTLLYPGQKVNVGILDPQINILEIDEVTSYEEKKYQTETKYDNSKYYGYQAVEQQGVNGKNKVTQKVQKINGVITSITPVSTEEIVPVVNEIIVKGGKSNQTAIGSGVPIATSGSWGWPATCNSVSSPYGWRGGGFHDGTDIAGCGFSSPIFAAQAGVVEASAKMPCGSYGSYRDPYSGDCYGVNGEYIIINHMNGWYSYYGHICKGCRVVSVGEYVEKGQVIGGMGQTGAATGVHVHFGIWYGYPNRGGKSYNAMQFY